MEKDPSSFKLWFEQAMKWPSQFFLVVFFIFLMIPLSLCLLVLIPHVIQTINSVPADVSWEKFLGHTISLWVSAFLEGTFFEKGISLSFQKIWFTPIIIFVSGTYCFLNYYSDYLLRDLGEKIAQSMRASICQKYLSLSYSDAISTDAGQLSSMVGEDMREAQQTFTRLVSSLLKDGLSAFVFIIWLVFLDYQLFALFSAILIPAALVLRITGKTLKKLSRHGLQFESDLLSGLLERMRGWQTIKIYKAIAFELEIFNKINTKIYHAWRRATRARTLSSPLIEWLGILAGTLIIITALRRTSNGELTNNILTSFTITVGFLSDKINRMSNQLNTTRKGTEALKRMKRFLSTEFELRKNINQGDILVNDSIDQIQFKDISIGNSKNQILVKDVNLDMKKGDFIVIIGSSGIGKSTLIRTLLGIQKPLLGEVLINKKQTDENSFEQISKEICFIPQEPFLFNGSIFENIIYPDKIQDPTEQDKEKASYALAFSTLERNLDDNITGLSGGERQRLMFARIFYRKPKLIVIDEGTSAIDIANELKIIENLKQHVSDSITFVVAHRPAVSHFATQVIDLSQYAV
jgi:subfamily B ATP-binding cassette protein MsbA